MSDRVVIYALITPGSPPLGPRVDLCREVCSAHGWRLARVVKEQSPARPRLAALVDEAAAGRFDRVVFDSWEAMSSDDGQDLHPLVHRIHGRGVQVSLAAPE